MGNGRLFRSAREHPSDLLHTRLPRQRDRRRHSLPRSNGLRNMDVGRGTGRNLGKVRDDEDLASDTEFQIGRAHV